MKSFKSYGITVEKRIHKGWEEHQAIIKSKKDKGAEEYGRFIGQQHPLGFFGKNHYIFTSSKGSISLIKLFDYYRLGEHIWEIYCIDEMKEWKNFNAVGEEVKVLSTPAKKALEDIRRFYKHQTAVKYIIEILRDK